MNTTTQGLTLATNRFSAFDPDTGVPVRFTLGNPRFKLRYKVAGNVPELAPGGRDWFRLSHTAYRDLYRDRLDQLGVAGITRLLQPYADRHGDNRIVLLCFEDITKPGDWCHRTMFAEWWTEQTGQDVPELQTSNGTRRPPARPIIAGEPATLF